MLFSQLRIHQIYGANTGVGKTIFSQILSLASATPNRRVFYLKPVSTGAPGDADNE
jgi:bifunctional dethiobiotin synthetase / adenosylmethionine---8-amino-7-oxononanoate aminotransferase